MYLIKQNYNLSNVLYYLYNEQPYLFIYTKHGIIKKTHLPQYLLKNKKFWHYIYIVNNKCKYINKQYKLILFINLLINSLRQYTLLTIGKLKFYGRGFKMLIAKPILILRLGYSHIIFNYLFANVIFKLKKKKKKYFVFYTTSKIQLYNKLSYISSMRIPDLYTRKGAYFRKLVI